MVGNIYSEIREIKSYALDHKIPIMVDEGIDFLTTFVIKHQIKNVLEIGTAIGYSAIMMALANPNLKVTSIERDKERYLEALKNIKKLNLENRITLIFKDALDVKLNDTFDLIFIDAAKEESEIKSHNLRALVRKIKQYITFLKENEAYHTTFYKTGDGIAVSERQS